MEDYKKELVTVGLSENEAAVYLAALVLGKGTIQEIARKAGIKRVTTYGVMESLMEHGLASSITEGKKQYFMAENPERVIDYVDQKKREYEEKEKRIKEIVPNLKELHQQQTDGPVVKYYTGKEGILSMIKNQNSEKFEGDIWMAYPHDTVKDFLTQEDRDKIRLSLHHKDIKIFSLYTSKDTVLENNEVSTRIRIDKSTHPLTADVAIYGDKVRLTALSDEKVGIIIESKSLSETLKTIFKLAWEGAKQHEK